MIFGLVRLIILSYNRLEKHIKRGARLLAAHALCYEVAILLCKKLSNKKSAGSVIFRPVRLITLYYI